MEQIQDERGEHQNIARASAVLSAIAAGPAEGSRLMDVGRTPGLGKATVHRILAGLVAHGLAEQDEGSNRFVLGMRLLGWAAKSSERFGLTRLTDPALTRLCTSTQDTIYLTLRTGDEAVCLDRREGSFPLKALTLAIGDKRPLGIGAGSLALLAFLPDDEKETIIRAQAPARAAYPFDDITLRQMIAEARRTGYAFNDVHVVAGMSAIHGMSAVAVPVRRRDGRPICAISVAAITSRMVSPRRDGIVASLHAEAERIEAELAPVLESPLAQTIARARRA